MKKTEKEFEKHVYSVIKKYIPILLLQRHTFEIKRGVNNPDAIMECKFRYPYLNSIIHYSDTALQKWKEGEDITPYIVHEMCHSITDPLYGKAINRYATRDEINDERENLTDLICNIVLNYQSK